MQYTYSVTYKCKEIATYCNYTHVVFLPTLLRAGGDISPLINEIERRWNRHVTAVRNVTLEEWCVVDLPPLRGEWEKDLIVDLGAGHDRRCIVAQYDGKGWRSNWYDGKQVHPERWLLKTLIYGEQE